MATVFHGFVDSVRLVNKKTGKIVDELDYRKAQLHNNLTVDDLIDDIVWRVCADLDLKKPALSQTDKDVVTVSDLEVDEDGNFMQYDILIKESKFPLDEAVKRAVIGLNREYGVPFS